MTITAKGFAGAAYQFDAGSWAVFHRRMGKLGGNDEGILSGGALSAVAGSLRLSVASFEGILPGLLVDNDNTPLQTPLHDAQAAGAGTRIDYLTLTGDWGTKTVYFEVVKGASATTPPALGAQTIGGLYRMPYARVAVRAGATAINLANDVERCYPVARVPILLSTSAFTARTLSGSGTAQQIAEIKYTDPGWPHRVKVNAAHLFTTGTTTSSDFGVGTMLAYLDSASIAAPAASLTELARARTDQITGNSGPHMVQFAGSSQPRTGPGRVLLQLSASGMTLTNDVATPVNRFELELIPVAA